MGKLADLDDQEIDDYGMMQVVGSPKSTAARKSASIKKSIESDRCDLVVPNQYPNQGTVPFPENDPSS